MPLAPRLPALALTEAGFSSSALAYLSPLPSLLHCRPGAAHAAAASGRPTPLQEAAEPGAGRPGLHPPPLGLVRRRRPHAPAAAAPPRAGAPSCMPLNPSAVQCMQLCFVPSPSGLWPPYLASHPAAPLLLLPLSAGGVPPAPGALRRHCHAFGQPPPAAALSRCHQLEHLSAAAGRGPVAGPVAGGHLLAAPGAAGLAAAAAPGPAAHGTGGGGAGRGGGRVSCRSRMSALPLYLLPARHRPTSFKTHPISQHSIAPHPPSIQPPASLF